MRFGEYSDGQFLLPDGMVWPATMLPSSFGRKSADVKGNNSG